MLQKHQRNGNERDESRSYTFRKQGSSSKRGSVGVARCFFKWHWNPTCMEESLTGSCGERFSGGQSGSGFLGICFHHNLNATFKVSKGFCCTTWNESSVKAFFSPCKTTEMSFLIIWKAFQKFCCQLLSTCKVANLIIYTSSKHVLLCSVKESHSCFECYMGE